MSYRKNVSGQNVPFLLLNPTNGAALTGATVTVHRSIDGGTQAAAAGAVTELGNGQYNFAPTAADMNGNDIGFLFTTVSQTARSGTAQGGSANTVTLDSGASTTNNAYAGMTVSITSGTGSGQTPVAIVSYNGSTKVATVSPNFTTAPDNTSAFTITMPAAAPVHFAVVTTAADPTNATNFGLSALPAAAAAATGGLPTIGTGTGQISLASGNVSANLVQIKGAASAGAAGYVGMDWGSIDNPTSTVNLSGTTIAGGGGGSGPTAAQIASAVWQDTVSGDFTVANSIGKSLYTAGNAPGAASGLAIVGSVMSLTTPSVASIVTGVWTDLTSGSDFTTVGSIGKLAATSIGADTPGTGTLLGRLTQAILFDGSGYVKSDAEALTQAFPANFSALGISTAGHISQIDAYTGDTPQTGDSFVRIGATGGGLTALAPASTALSTAQWTNTLAALLNTLAGHDPGGILASAASQASILNAVNAITSNTARTAITVPQFEPLPASGNSAVLVKIKLFDLHGTLEDADANSVTIHATNSAGTSLDVNLSSTTATRDSTGQYHATYTLHSTDAEGAVYLSLSYTVGGVGMAADAAFSVAQADTVTSIASILSTVNTINASVGTAGAGLTNLGDARLVNLDSAVSSRMATFSLPTRFASLAIDSSGYTTFGNTSIGVSGDFSAAMKFSLNAATPTVTLAADQHVIVDSGTVTTLANLPVMPAGWITQAGIAAGALNDKGNWALSASAPVWYSNTVTVGNYASGQDPWSIWKAATPSNNSSPGTNEWRMHWLTADQYTDETTDPEQWHTVFVIGGTGAPGTGITLGIKKLWDTTGAKVNSNSQVIGQASE